MLVTTHYLEEAETLADRLEIMHAGRDRPFRHADRDRGGHPSTISFAASPKCPDDLAGVTRIVHEHGRTTLETEALQRSLTDLMAWAAHNNVALDDSRRSQPEPGERLPLDRRRPRPGRPP